MQLTKLLDEQNIKSEYGLRGIRTFPWAGVIAPFGSGYCIVGPNSETFRHVNDPADEEEIFIACQGYAIVLIGDQEIPVKAGDQVYIPQGVPHSILNKEDEEFHFFTIWWNSMCVSEYLKAKNTGKS